MICLSLHYYDFDSVPSLFHPGLLPKSFKKVHALHRWADSLKTHERDAIPKEFLFLKGVSKRQSLWNDTALAHSFFKFSEKLNSEVKNA
jgi:hypothetical protein